MSDFTDAQSVEKQLRRANNALHASTQDVASARQIKEFASERRKNLLAKFMALLVSEKSAATAEVLARANPDYGAALEALERQYLAAENVIAKWQATQATFEAARSLLSMSRETMRQLQG